MRFVAEHCFERGHTYFHYDLAIAWIPPDLEARGHALEEPHWTLQYLSLIHI